LLFDIVSLSFFSPEPGLEHTTSGLELSAKVRHCKASTLEAIQKKHAALGQRALSCPFGASGMGKMDFGMKTILLSLSLLIFLVSFAPSAEAQSSGNYADRFSGLFLKNRLSAQLVTGALFTPASWMHDHGKFNYAQTNVRIGWMANDPKESKYFGRGNFEFLFEFTNSIIFDGAGSYLRGFTLLCRYNWLLSNPKWVSYIQIGGGAVVNDAYKDRSQSEIGQSVEFTAQGSIGLRRFIGKKWTFDVEAMYHHISNAGLSDRNRGINAFGGFLGVTYFLDKLWQRYEQEKDFS
jgi:lipid A 3-O-deacylase